MFLSSCLISSSWSCSFQETWTSSYSSANLTRDGRWPRTRRRDGWKSSLRRRSAGDRGREVVSAKKKTHSLGPPYQGWCLNSSSSCGCRSLRGNAEIPNLCTNYPAVHGEQISPGIGRTRGDGAETISYQQHRRFACALTQLLAWPLSASRRW